MNIKTALGMAACLFLVTCTKDKGTTSSTDNFVVGITTDLLTKQYDTVLTGDYHKRVYLDLDLNDDKYPDFRLTSEVWGSPGLGEHPRSTIIPLNPACELLGFLKNDTSYLHRSTTTTIGANNTVSIYNAAVYSCRQIAANDSITNVQLDQFKLIPKKKGDQLVKSDFFKSDTCTLMDDRYNYPTLSSTSNDTTVYNATSFDFTCNSYPGDVISYIGIKIKGAQSEKLGWLKLSISDQYKISILESAIQK